MEQLSFSPSIIVHEICIYICGAVSRLGLGQMVSTTFSPKLSPVPLFVIIAADEHEMSSREPLSICFAGLVVPPNHRWTLSETN